MDFTDNREKDTIVAGRGRLSRTGRHGPKGPPDGDPTVQIFPSSLGSAFGQNRGERILGERERP